MRKKNGELEDGAEVHFEVSRGEDSKLWTLSVSCKDALTDEEFAGACIALGHDILEGKVDLELGDDVETH